MTKLIRALSVIVYTPSIREFLTKNDPKALQQAEEALSEALRLSDDEIEERERIQELS